MKFLGIALFLAGMAGTGLAQMRPTSEASVTGLMLPSRVDSLHAVSESRYDSIRQSVAAAQDSLRSRLGIAGDLIRLPEIAGWMPAFPELKFDPATLARHAGFTGLPSDMGDFGMLKDIAASGDPRAVAGTISGLPDGMSEQGIVNDHFSSKSDALSNAMAELDKYKEKYDALEGLPDVNLKFINTMRGKPLAVRLIPGVWFRLVRRDGPDAEFSPVVRYRITGKLSLGLGWVTRVRMDDGIPRQLATGPSFSTLMQLGKGFDVLTEYRSMKRPGEKADGRYSGFFTGLRKNFPVTRTITGFAAAQYDWNRHTLQLTPGDRLQTRMGFEFRLGKGSKGEEKVNNAVRTKIRNRLKALPREAFPVLE